MGPFTRWALTLLIIIGEFFLIYLYKDGLAPFSSEFSVHTYLNEYGGWQFWLATHTHHFFKDLLYFLTLVLILRVAGEFRRSNFWRAILGHGAGVKNSLVNLISFSVLLGMLIFISDPRELIANPYSLVSIFYTVSPVLLAIYFGSVLSLLFSLRGFGEWALNHRVLTVFILSAAELTIHQEFIEGVVDFWSGLLLGPTLQIASAMTRGMGLDTQLFSNGGPGPSFGTSRFVVEIWPACSGYEGMALIIALLAGYCYLERDTLRINRALLIIPLASLAMFFLNSARIAILILIGHTFSPKLALSGFHIVGGWLDVLIVLSLSFFALNFSNFFLKNPQLLRVHHRSDLPFLLPLAVLIASSLLCKIFSPDFDWLYPIPISLQSLFLIIEIVIGL